MFVIAEWARGELNVWSTIANGMHRGKPASAPSEKIEEEALFHDPFRLLTQLASQAESAKAVAAPGTADTRIGAGSSRDPFVTYYITDPFVKWITAAWRHETGLDTRATAPPALGLKSGAETAEDRKPKNATAPSWLRLKPGSGLANRAET